jgi:protein-glutamine gamma-glutamyltransferase
MNIQRAAPINELLAKLIFLIAPTCAAGYFILLHLNSYYSILGNQVIAQTIYLGAGMLISALFYTFRFRFLPTFLILIFIFTAFYKGLDSYSAGEFDTFFASVRFLLFAMLFSGGWLLGWGFLRLRYWSVLMSAVVLCGCIALIAKAKVDNPQQLMLAFSPAVLFSVYIIFAAEQIYSYKDKSKLFWWFLIRRLAFFSVLIGLIFAGVAWLLRGQIHEVVDSYGGQGKEGANSMLNKTKNGFNLKDYQKLRSSQGRGNDLLFCAHIENFFPGTKEPNPLYLTAFYFTKFDTSTETFERDSTIPFNDLFEPNPTKVPLFTTNEDTSVIHNSLGPLYRKIVDIEVYCKDLDPSTYLAPNVGFFVQPITVEKDFRQEFKSAYRAKSYVSELNSAYFVYNINKPEWRQFQEMRFNVLRGVSDYEGVDNAFFKYYTYMPAGENFKKITELAHQITDSAATPVDKVIALRDYFLSKDGHGDPLYKYTDNPGEPDIPNASKLMYFLFENHKGYCAYFAGATLFMLRALGIPSRIAVGFLTENRSDKNKGWYWYYAKQAHAWVQVYFPGYGWLDFDTTVGNTDARESPKPDGTPPMQPPKAWLAAEGIIDDVDTLKKTMKLQVRQFVFHDKEYKLPHTMPVTLDMKIAVVYRDSISIPLKAVMRGDSCTAVSYADVMKKLEPGANESASGIIKKFPEAVPTDEVYLKKEAVSSKKEAAPVVSTPKKESLVKLFQKMLLALFAMILLALLMPYFIYRYYRIRYSFANGADKLYWAYTTSCYYLHIVGIPRFNKTPMHFAKSVVDPALGTNFTGFMNVYLKQKYGNAPLTENEKLRVADFLEPFIKQVTHKVPGKNRLLGFLSLSRCVNFYLLNDEIE